MESNIEKQAKEVDEKGFIPTNSIEIESLPSKGKAYGTAPEITVRPYSFGEVKRISDSQLSMSEKLATIVSGVNTNFLKDKLTFADITYLGMVRKLHTLGGLQAKYPYTCPDCGHKNEKIFSQKDIEIVDLEVEQLPVTVTLSDGKQYEFEPINYKDMLAIDKGIYNKDIPSGSMLKDKVAIYALLCKNKQFKDAYNFFSMTTDFEDQEILEEVDKILNHDVKPLEATCSKCNTKVLLPMKNAVDMVLPFRSEKGSVRDRISFGKGTILSRD